MYKVPFRWVCFFNIFYTRFWRLISNHLVCTFICSVDQDTIEKCTSTQNTWCVCKQGSFCLPDQACEVCKKCSKYVFFSWFYLMFIQLNCWLLEKCNNVSLKSISVKNLSLVKHRCKEDEEIVERCTVGSNTVCRKRESFGSSLSGTLDSHSTTQYIHIFVVDM